MSGFVHLIMHRARAIALVAHAAVPQRSLSLWRFSSLWIWRNTRHGYVAVCRHIRCDSAATYGAGAVLCCAIPWFPCHHRTSTLYYLSQSGQRDIRPYFRIIGHIHSFGQSIPWCYPSVAVASRGLLTDDASCKVLVVRGVARNFIWGDINCSV